MAKKSYQKPTILKLQNFMAAKHGAPASRRVRSHIDGVSIDQLVEKFGSPLFVFSERTIRRKYRTALEAFSSRYPNVQFAWSYKTNYLKAICSIFHQEGSIAEVVSQFEYDKARKLGVDGKDIIFNGPYKTHDALLRAAKEGAMIHIDHFDEISDLEKVADELGITIPVAIRLNMDTKIHHHWSRFGFNLDNGQAMSAVKRLAVSGKLTLTGLHAHIGTFMLEPKAYQVEAQKMARFMLEVEKSFNFHIKYLDLGGGFPSKSHLKGVYQPPEVSVPDIDDFAESLTSGLYDALPGGQFPLLYLESGRHLIDEAGFLITSVVAQKNLADGRRSYIMDAGVNLLYTYFWYNFKVEMDRVIEGIREPAILNGPLCMNIDILDESIMLPRLSRGQRLILSPVGAYSVTQWMQFIHYRPRVLLIGEDGNVDIIREKEELHDIEAREQCPERLAFSL
ncbi:alanine racemase [Magnetococcales bacterium HHB-1]